MLNLWKSESVFSLHRDQNVLYAVTVQMDKTPQVFSAEVDELADFEFDPTLHEQVAASFPAKDILIRPLDLKLKKEKALLSVLPFEAEPLLPFPIEEAVLTFAKRETLGQTTHLSLFAARQESVELALENWEEVGVDPDYLFPESQGLATLCKAVLPEEEKTTTTFVIHFGEESVIALLQKNGVPLGIHTVHLDQEGLKLELERILLSLSKQFKSLDISGVFFTGKVTEYQELKKELLLRLQIDEVLPEETFGLEEKEILLFAIPVGLALTTQDKTLDNVNLRKDSFAPSNPWKPYVKPLYTYGAACLLLLVSLFLFSKATISYELRELQQSYNTLLRVVDLPSKEVEFEFPSGAKQLSDLSFDEIQSRVSWIQKKVAKDPEYFPLYPDVPNLSDLLAWLGSHPYAKAPAPGEAPLIEIQSLQYTLVKRPDSKKKREKYRVKVDLEFQTGTPKNAREFHEALLKPNDFVDPKTEVKWNASQNLYRTTFFLKNRTPKLQAREVNGE